MKNSNANWNYYLTFVNAYETSNLQRTAEMMGISRPLVTHHLNELGNQLGVKLFCHDTVNRCVTPTSDATEIYPQLKEYVDGILDVEENLRIFDEQSSAIIRLTIPSSIVSHVIAGFIAEFCTKYPKVRLEFDKREDSELLQHKKIDLAIEAKKYLIDKNFQVVNLLEMKPVFIVSRDFLIKNDISPTASLEEIVKYPIVALREILNIIEDKTGIKIETSVLISSTENIYHIVKNGLGIGIIWDKVLASHDNTKDEIVKIALEDFSVSEVFACAYNRSHLTKAAKIFLEGLMLYCKNLSN